jgi:outer membrane biosynthesis protein TonB
MQLRKPRVPIDYVHDAKEVVGYLNRFDSSSGDLVTSGALVPFKESDRATEIVHKMKAGVPYEASINFGGDGIKVEELAQGMVAQVNGYQLEGPAVIIREWPLRGVAICPYGADENTESATFANGKTFSATVASATVPQPNKPTEEAQMSESVEVAEVAQETTEAAVEEKKPEEAAPEAQAVEEVPAVETEQKPEEQKPVELSREEFTRIADRFGNDIAVRCMREGKDFSTALTWHVEALESENKSLKEKVGVLSASSSTTGKPVAMSAAGKPALTLEKLCEKGTKGKV